MSRVKKAVASRKRRKKVLKLAKGYRGARSKLYRTATEAVDRAMKYAYRDRRARKRNLRRLWIARINAGARTYGISYSRLINGMKKAGIGIDRKILAELAISDQQAFSKVVEEARLSLGNSVH